MRCESTREKLRASWARRFAGGVDIASPVSCGSRRSTAASKLVGRADLSYGRPGADLPLLGRGREFGLVRRSKRIVHRGGGRERTDTPHGTRLFSGDFNSAQLQRPAAFGARSFARNARRFSFGRLGSGDAAAFGAGPLEIRRARGCGLVEVETSPAKRGPGGPRARGKGVGAFIAAFARARSRVW